MTAPLPASLLFFAIEWLLTEGSPAAWREELIGLGGSGHQDGQVRATGADHAWRLAKDVDRHWAGIDGTRALITRLITDSRLDVVPADPPRTNRSTDSSPCPVDEFFADR